jgi:conjugative relaxase-like TrwC/TraI family protein
VTVSLRTGYDTGYLTEAAGVDYYTGADGEPPGYWQGKGAAALGLAGDVDAEVMRRLYHEDIGPDGQLLRPQRKAKYPATGRNSMYERIEAEVEAVRAERGRFFTPEEERKLRLQLRSAYRTSVPFYDMTFSAPKSVSVLWASLLAASAEAAAEGREADAERLAGEAEQIRGAVRRANDRMIAVLERDEAYIRTGHHSANSGEYRDADGFIVASFPQHDSRDGDPQLHVHNAIANLAQRADEADERWRALHAQPLFRNKGRYSTLAERYLGQELELLGLRTVLRPDGMALEIGGTTDEAMNAFSSRSKALRARTRELVMEYEAEHGHAPAKRAMWAIRQQATIETREAKQHGAKAAGAQLAGWAQQAAQSGMGALTAVSGATASYAAEHSPPVLPGAALRARIIRKAVATVQAGDATWNRCPAATRAAQHGG